MTSHACSTGYCPSRVMYAFHTIGGHLPACGIPKVGPASADERRLQVKERLRQLGSGFGNASDFIFREEVLLRVDLFQQVLDCCHRVGCCQKHCFDRDRGITHVS